MATDDSLTEDSQYQVSFEAFAHITVEAENEDEAIQKARQRLSGMDYTISEERVNGPYDD